MVMFFLFYFSSQRSFSMKPFFEVQQTPEKL